MTMQSIGLSASPIAPKPDRRGSLSWIAMALLLIGVATLLRFAWFDVPIFGLDEQFYVLVGQRMLDGAVPYVDIFDRKPYGLLALFAGLAAIGGDPLMTAKIAATVAAAATALFVVAIAGRRAPGWPALSAGIFYLVAIGMAEGQTNQSPILYNLLVVSAGWMVLRTAPALDHRGDVRRAALAMLLCGIAIQMKTTAALEGVAIGLWTVLRLARRDGHRACRIALILAAIGSLPTVVVATGYAMTGHFAAWWFATVVSQSLKTGGTNVESLYRLLPLTAVLAGPLLSALIGRARLPDDEYRTLLTAWLSATLVGVFVIGNFHAHYALPVFVPAAILAAGLFAMPRFGIPAFLALAVLPGVVQILAQHRDAAIARPAFAQAMAALPADVRTRCLLAYSAPMAYYVTSHACMVTPYIFIDQLATSVEQHALPIDATAAMRAALGRRPGTIITVDHSGYTQRNAENDAMMATALAHDYRKTATIPHGFGWRDPRPLEIWRRRDLID